MFFPALLVLLLAALANCFKEVPGTRQAAPPPTEVTTGFECSATAFDVGCANCTMLKVCLASLGEVDVNCPDTPEKPFCASGACSATPDPSANCAATSITCTGVGIYPDPSNCQVYHNCLEVGVDNSDPYICPTDYVFNAATGLCRRKRNAADCVQIKCPAGIGFGTYGTSKTYYAFCYFTATNTRAIAVFKCSDGATFDGSKCVYQCKKEGMFPNTTDLSSYYQCYIVGGKFEAVLQACPSGKNFDATKKVCV